MIISTNNNGTKLLFTLLFTVVLSACQVLPVNKNVEIVHDEYVSTGDLLPIDNVTTIDGEVINMQQLGKRKLVILFATWCGDSNRLLKQLNTSPLLEDDSVEIIAIAREEDRETVTAWRDEHTIKVKLAVDTGRLIYKNFASGGIPRVITVSESNKIIKMNLAEGEQQLDKIVWK